MPFDLLSFLAALVGCGLTAFALGQLMMAFVLSRKMRTYVPTSITDSQLPKAAILLPLRGGDPELKQTIRRLLTQDYPNYELHIVVDQLQDPAYEICDSVIRELGATHARLTTIRKKLDTCGPQCSAMIQAVGDLDSSFEMVAIIDGDVVAHPGWLRGLVGPVLDPKVGIAHGNRWFMPRDSQWGSLVRYLWNTGTVVAMYMGKWPWAGSCAIRRSVVIDSGLAGQWPRSVVPDSPATSCMAKMGLSIEFIPSHMMVNRERCDLAFAHDFFKRQMTWGRLYHPNFTPILVHALFILTLMIACCGLAATGAILGDWPTVFWAAGGFIAYIFFMLLQAMVLEWGVRKVVRARGEPTTWFTPLAWLKLPLVVPLTHISYTIGALQAQFNRFVTFRGVTYELRGKWDIRILKDQVYNEPMQEAANTSTK